jgi:hypothetical protein
MPRPSKINPVKLRQYLRSGKSQREIAKIFGVSDSAISMRRKDLNLNMAKSVQLENAHACVLDCLDVIGQLSQLNNDSNYLLDLLMSAIRCEQDATAVLKKHQELGAIGTKMRFEDPKSLVLKVMKQIQDQLKLQINILETVTSFEAVANFQAEVIALIAEMDIDLKKKFVERLREKKAIRSSITL